VVNKSQYVNLGEWEFNEGATNIIIISNGMKPYKAQSIEKKWQKVWEANGHPKPIATKGKYYILDMFPYPSGDGLHVGHVENYTATDILSRYKRMNGFDVMHPIGWDAFGLPAENFAIKTGIHPDQKTHENIANFTRQIKSLGMSYDWDREIDTSSPEYYKWTQWMFLFLYKNGLAYKKKAHVNWCPSCQTVLANEQVIDGKCDRCKSEVAQKDLEQWFFKITDFVEDMEGADGKKVSGLLSGLEKVDWPYSTKAAQKNWIGRSVGTTVKFQIAECGMQNEKSEIDNLKSAIELEVFTTRVDTIFGCTYVVISPEHPLLMNGELRMTNEEEIKAYQEITKKKTDLERTELNKDKTGVKLEGIEAINPFTGESVPVFVADYVLGNYGTGAVMAVPAHDERDYEFAKKYDLPIKQSIASNRESFDKTVKALRVLEKISSASREKDLKVWVLGGLACAFHAGVIYREHSDLDLIVKDNDRFEEMGMLLETLGFKKKSEKQLTENLTNFVFEDGSGFQIDLGPNKGEFCLIDGDFEENEKELNGVRALVLSKRFITAFKEFQLKSRTEGKDRIDIEYLRGKVFTDDGIVVDSGEYAGLPSSEARGKMTAWLEEKNLGAKKVNYRLRDWLISRQRYWGAPIPIIYCDECGSVPVPEKDLPVKLPTDVDFRPTGESPLLRSESFQNVSCPKCDKKARREADTMDTFVCSSWYYLRFADPKNTEKFADPKKLEELLPVDFYMGGAEHTVLHLLYARFFTKALAKYGYLKFDEPFVKLRHQGMVIAEDGRKMSKSLGNVVNPDDVVGELGADTLRLYEMFMGPLEDMKAWNTGSVVGLRRFLERAWRLQEKIRNQESGIKNRKVESLIHRTIKKITDDIENLKYNTAISSMMICLNELEKEESFPLIHYSQFLILLSSFAPHIAEELWSQMGNEKSIFLEEWPKYDEEKMVDEMKTIVVQVNGKVRANLPLPTGSTEEVVKEAALSDENVRKHLDGKEIRKVVYIQDKILNIVV
jgi:leucyl-tRNA synthetase